MQMFLAGVGKQIERHKMAEAVKLDGEREA